MYVCMLLWLKSDNIFHEWRSFIVNNWLESKITKQIWFSFVSFCGGKVHFFTKTPPPRFISCLRAWLWGKCQNGTTSYFSMVFFTSQRYASAVYAIGLCPSVTTRSSTKTARCRIMLTYEVSYGLSIGAISNDLEWPWRSFACCMAFHVQFEGNHTVSTATASRAVPPG